MEENKEENKEEDKEEDKSPKEKEQEVIQTLINLPTIRTPTKQMSTDIVPLKISALGSSSTKVTRVLHYGDPELDEEIVILSYDSKTMNLDQGKL